MKREALRKRAIPDCMANEPLLCHLSLFGIAVSDGELSKASHRPRVILKIGLYKSKTQFIFSTDAAMIVEL